MLIHTSCLSILQVQVTADISAAFITTSYEITDAKQSLDIKRHIQGHESDGIWDFGAQFLGLQCQNMEHEHGTQE